tara:strand:+ start:1050 stop:2645 length:1596 start_codon:yes stop_codon:yes gene_type:complete
MENMLDIYSIDMECQKTWNLISSGMTKGVFQLESPLGRSWAKKVKPRSLEELAALIALIRPGCLKAMSGDPPKSMAQRYVDRKFGEEDLEYFHPSLETILGSTYGVLVYQEQAMQMAQVLAGFDLQEADVLRKAIGKKKADIMAKVKKSFLTGASKEGVVTKEEAEEIFSWIQESQRYSFNKSHAVSYAKNAYWSAYCKTHYPHQFFCSYLVGSAWKQDPHEEVQELVNDSKIIGIDVLPPDFRDVKKTFYLKDDSIFFGMSDIKQVGSSAVDKISVKIVEVEAIIEKKVAAWSWADYLIFFSKNISSTVNKALMSSGSLDYFKVPRNQMLYEVELWNKLTVKEMEWVKGQNSGEGLFPKVKSWGSFLESLIACQPVKKEGGGCSNSKRSQILLDIIKTTKNPPHKLNDSPAWISWAEEKFLGAALTCSKVEGCSDSVKSNTTCKEFIDGKEGFMVFAVEINRSKQIMTKRGTKMAFLSISDSSCCIDSVVCFTQELEDYQGILHEGNTILLQAEKDKKRGGLIVKKAWQI